MTTKIIDKRQEWRSQYQKVFTSLYKYPQTRFEVSVKTGVPLQNVCRYIHTLKKNRSVFITAVDHCRISGRVAEYISTHPKYARGKQLQIFTDGVKDSAQAS